jgi:hypothetical protein
MAVAHGLEDAAAAAGPDEDLVRGVGATDARRDLAMVPREADLLGRRGRDDLRVWGALARQEAGVREGIEV